MKIISYLSLAVSVLGACVIFIYIIVWGVSLPQTALLWLNGPVSGWADSTLIIARREDYDNRGNFEGVPVFVIGPADLPRVQPANVFDLLNGGNITDKVAGVIDWETRAAWLSHFTDEEKAAAVQIEKHLKTLTAA